MSPFDHDGGPLGPATVPSVIQRLRSPLKSALLPKAAIQIGFKPLVGCARNDELICADYRAVRHPELRMTGGVAPPGQMAAAVVFDCFKPLEVTEASVIFVEKRD